MPTGVNEWQKEHPWEPSPTAHPEPVPLVKPADLLNPYTTIAEIMKRDPAVCHADSPVTDAVRILRESASSGVFIVSDGRPLGLLTDRCIALAVSERGDKLGNVPVKELMQQPAPTVPADAHLDVLLHHFSDAGVAAVDGDGRIQGVVRWKELLGHLSERALGLLVVQLFSPRKER